jgi:hypothetical protein
VAGNTAVCRAPCSIGVTIRVEPNEANRAINFRIEGDGDYYTNSTIELDGLDSPATQRIRWYDHIGPGSYTIQAVLLRTASLVAVARATRNLVVD